jgi:hypothetical protein
MLANLVGIFHAGIVLILVSLSILPFSPVTAEVAGAGALVFFLAFIVAGLYKKQLMVDGEKVSAFSTVRYFNDHSVIIVSLFLLLFLYLGLNRTGLLPGIYSDEFPKAYYELVNNATSRKEKAVNGRYRYEEFKEKYDQFIKSINTPDK